MSGRNVGGWFANQVADGKVYNRYDGTYAPLTGVRVAAGVAGQVGGPVGVIGGKLANWLATRNNPAQREWDNHLAFDTRYGGHVDPFGSYNPSWSGPSNNMFLNGTLANPYLGSFASNSFMQGHAPDLITQAFGTSQAPAPASAPSGGSGGGGGNRSQSAPTLQSYAVGRGGGARAGWGTGGGGPSYGGAGGLAPDFGWGFSMAKNK